MNSARISELLKTRPKTNLSWGIYSVGAPNGAKPDLGIAVAKKLVKRAVDRNRLKRMIRELVWAAQVTTLNDDVVVKLKKPIGRNTRGRLRKKEKDLLRSQVAELI
ncbi:ribonuclease P protein component [Polynucleobacter wuianus]|uniref:ribonuclease P protein component n=1 Tax=Polynucleobacter wuianus TaxID=1743168 RepID=UPI001C0B4C51|nr:ribonuclease P protein component [Polynucleobacter wuianus]MBU3609928.1 ribonuclease P protein component [Polynucleobacter wuianus]